jgi:hypothetical protein
VQNFFQELAKFVFILNDRQPLLLSKIFLMFYNQHHIIPERIFLLVVSLFYWGTSTVIAQGFAQFYDTTFNIGSLGRSIWPNPEGYLLASTNVSVQTNTDGEIVRLGPVHDSGSAGDYWYAMNNGDFLALKSVEDDSVLQVQRLRPDGTPIWQKTYSLGESNQLNRYNILGFGIISYVIQDEDGSVYISGFFENETDLTMDVYMIKIAPNGDKIWQRTIDRNLFYLEDDFFQHLKFGPNGQCAILEYVFGNNFFSNADDSAKMTLVDADGSTITSFPIPPAHAFGDGNSGYLFYLTSTIVNNQESNIRLVRLDNTGQIVHEVPLTSVLAPLLNTTDLNVYHLIRTSDGNYVLVVSTGINLPFFRNAVAKITPQGQLLWSVPLPQKDAGYGISDLEELENGSIGLLGNVSNSGDACFIKIAADGTLYQHQIVGRVAHDTNDNCWVDASESGLDQWFIRVNDDQFQWFSPTSDNGTYQTIADSGVVTLELLPPNYLWEVCDNPVTVSFTSDTAATVTPVDFSVRAATECPFMQVELNIPGLLRGQNAPGFVQYCNKGTALAEQATAQLMLDSRLTLLSASVPFTLTNGVAVFQLGNLAPGDCGQIEVLVQVPDDDALLGLSLCSTVSATPDVLCPTALTGQWSGALLEVRGYCQTDTVYFEVKNAGTAPNTPNLEYIIADDHVIMFNGGIPSIPAGEKLTFRVPANGNSWRFGVEQEPFTPEFRAPSVPVEGCPDQAVTWSLGLANQLYNTTGSPFSDIECRIVGEIVLQPNLILSANPTGVPPLNLVAQQSKIDYMVSFDLVTPVNEVLIADTLDPNLDYSTLSVGPSNVPFTWHMGTNGVLYLKTVADSATTISAGFVQFSAVLKPGLDTGTIVYNAAALSADLAPAQSTNLVFHTVGVPQTSGAGQVPDMSAGPLVVQPNPADQIAFISWPDAAPEQVLVVRNALGQVVRTQPVHGRQTTLPRNGLAGGVYWLEISGSGGKYFGTLIFR